MRERERKRGRAELTGRRPFEMDELERYRPAERASVDRWVGIRSERFFILISIVRHSHQICDEQIDEQDSHCPSPTRRKSKRARKLISTFDSHPSPSSTHNQSRERLEPFDSRSLCSLCLLEWRSPAATRRDQLDDDDELSDPFSSLFPSETHDKIAEQSRDADR